VKNIIGIILAGFVTVSCGQTGSAPALQSHLAAAQTGAASTAGTLKTQKTHLDTADYKGSRARGLIRQGVEQ
jgi:hypothetical protein